MVKNALSCQGSGRVLTVSNHASILDSALAAGRVSGLGLLPSSCDLLVEPLCCTKHAYRPPQPIGDTTTMAHLESDALLPPQRQRRLRVTRRYSGRRGRSPSPLPPPVPSLSNSQRLTATIQEEGGDKVEILGRLLQTLEDSRVPGPQFFRLRQEFSVSLGEGGQGNVRGIDPTVAERYDKAGEEVRRKWPVRLIAIKQYQERNDNRVVAKPAAENDRAVAHARIKADNELTSRFRAAEREVLALGPPAFRGHPNIVQLVGWGLCLDTLESPHDLSCCGPLQLPLLVLERADMNFEQFLRLKVASLARRRHHGSVLDPEEARHEEQWQEPHVEMPRGTGGLSSFAIHALAFLWKRFTQGIGLAQDPYETIRLLCIDIGQGLGCLHQHGFTHGDLKPENVLIFRTKKEGWQAKLCDFGCAIGKTGGVENSDCPESGSQSKSGSKNDGGASTNSTNLASEAPRVEFKISYCGTPMFLPPKDELKSSLPFEGLLNCDLYVYGLVVWYAFSGCRPLPSHATVEEAERRRVELVEQLSWGFSWWPVLQQRDLLENKLKRVLESTLQTTPHERGRSPWTFLYNDKGEEPIGGRIKGSDVSVAESVEDDVEDDVEDGVIAHEQQPQQGGDDEAMATKIRETKVPLEPSIKARYNHQSWWSTTRIKAPSTSTHGEPADNLDDIIIDLPSREPSPLSGIQGKMRPQDEERLHANQFGRVPIIITTEFVGVDDDGTGEGGAVGAVSSEALDKDDDALKLALFDTQRRRSEVAAVRREMSQIFPWQATASTGGVNMVNRERLYFLARFRSRIPLSWWDGVDDSNISNGHESQPNFVLKALRVPVEISTLAWLCKGPVGRREVELLETDPVDCNLAPVRERLDRRRLDWWVNESKRLEWRLNESERLDRFLLLLQFGARVDRHFPDLWSKKSALDALIYSCRPATIEPTAEKIFQRLGLAMRDGLIPNIRGQELAWRALWSLQQRLETSPGPSGRRWKPESVAGILPDQQVPQNLSGRQPLLETDRNGSSHSTNDNITTLQKGWTVSKHSDSTPARLRSWFAFLNTNKTTCYEDDFTQTITIISPQVSLLERRQVKVGFLDRVPTASYCHVDLLACHGGRSRRPQRHHHQRLELAADMGYRFPYYNDDWFLTEWRRELPHHDLLGELIDTETWKLPSFSTRLPLPEIGVMTLIMQIMLFVAAVAFLIGLAVVSAPIIGLMLILTMTMGGLYLLSGFTKFGAIVAVVAGKVLGLIAYYYFVEWTCPGSIKLGKGPRGPGEDQFCEVCCCWWIILSWWSC